MVLAKEIGYNVIHLSMCGKGRVKEKLLPGLLQEAPPVSNSLNSVRSAVMADVAKLVTDDGVSTNGSFLRVYHDLQSHLAESLIFESHTLPWPFVVVSRW